MPDIRSGVPGGDVGVGNCADEYNVIVELEIQLRKQVENTLPVGPVVLEGVATDDCQHWGDLAAGFHLGQRAHQGVAAFAEPMPPMARISGRSAAPTCSRSCAAR